MNFSFIKTFGKILSQQKINKMLANAVANDDAESVKTALELGAYETGNAHFEYIFTAVKNENVEIVKALIEKNYGYVNTRDRDEFTPLHYAMRNKSMDCFKLLLENDAIPRITNKFGQAAFEIPLIEGTEIYEFAKGCQLSEKLNYFNDALIDLINDFRNSKKESEMLTAVINDDHGCDDDLIIKM